MELSTAARCERWLDEYDLYDNIYQSALDLFIEDTSSLGGFICLLKGNDLSFLNNEKEMYLLGYQNTPIEKSIRTKTPLIVKSTKIPYTGEITSFFGIPVQNKERVLGIVGLYGGVYTLQIIRKYKAILLTIRLEMEKIDTYIPSTTKTKDLFMANMSHEIRTPLNGVIGYTQLLRQTKATDIQRQYIQSINKCSLNLAQIINDILDFSKLSSGKMTMNICPTRIVEVVEFVKDTLSPKIRDKNHTMSINVSGNLPEYVIVDKQKLIQVMMNLVANAIKFTDKNGKINITVDQADIDSIRFSVSDNGVGIARENQTKLFRSFSQLDNTLTKSYDGTGLGLAICKKLIELMKGEISFKSSLGVGSEFFFTVKYSKVDESKCTISENYKGKPVLVISNSFENRMYLSDTLLKIGMKPTPCSTVPEALQLMKSYIYDFELCVSDEDIEDKVHQEYPLIPIVRVQRECIFKLVENVEKVLRESRYVKKKDSLKIKKDIRILIAEDNPDNQDVLVTMLKTLGYINICVENDGVGAVQAIQTRTFDVLLLDLKMPRLDGYQVMDYLKKSSSKLKVIPVTASVMEEDQLKCKSYGTKWFLRKPIDMKELQQCLMME